MTTQRGYRYDPMATYAVREFDLEYLRVGDDTRQVRIYQPEGPGPFPMVLSVHGGAWSRGDHTNNPLTSRPLAASGLVVAVIGLRVAPQFPYPLQVQDTNYATRWLKAHARDFNGDLDTLGGIGYSSGGHTLPLAAMRPSDPRYAALPLADSPSVDANLEWMVVCWPVIDPWVRYQIAQEKGDQGLVERHHGYFLGEEAMHEANPQEMLDRGEKVTLPPVLVVHGTADDVMPIEAAARFVNSYNAAGGQAQLEPFEGMPHSFGNEPSPQTDRLVQVVKEFIAKQLG
jgi:acetyl esterase